MGFTGKNTGVAEETLAFWGKGAEDDGTGTEGEDPGWTCLPHPFVAFLRQPFGGEGRGGGVRSSLFSCLFPDRQQGVKHWTRD